MAMQRPRSSKFRSGFEVTASHSELHRRILPDPLLSISAELVLSPTPSSTVIWQPSLPEKQRTSHAPPSHIGFAAACKLSKQYGISRSAIEAHATVARGMRT